MGITIKYWIPAYMGRTKDIGMTEEIEMI